MMRGMGHVARVGETSCTYKILVEEPEEKIPNDIKVNFKNRT
jgi:hypothetical protein